jgi:hypothetical protein
MKGQILNYMIRFFYLISSESALFSNFLMSEYFIVERIHGTNSGL